MTTTWADRSGSGQRLAAESEPRDRQGIRLAPLGRASTPSNRKMIHHFTVDVEEHFQVSAFENVVSRGILRAAGPGYWVATIPGTRMPTNFPRSAETGDFTSPLGGSAIDTPGFTANKARLLPHFQSEEDLRKTMSDAVALTGYLRDYIWSVGIREMREARPQPAAPTMTVPQGVPTTPPVTPMQTGGG